MQAALNIADQRQPKEVHLAMYRRIFAVPIACLAMMAAIIWISPTPTAGYLGFELGATATYDNVASFSLSDYAISATDQSAIGAERLRIDGPIDAHRAAYLIDNQPLTAWRFAVDAYSRIDPNRRMI